VRWSSEGFVLSLKPHNEKSYILEVLTIEHGKHKGLIRGVHSKNIRSIIEPGNEIIAHWSGRLETHLGNYGVESIKSWSSLILNDRKKLCALTSACSLISNTIAEKQPNENIYTGLKFLIQILTSNKDQWIKDYIIWELNLLTEIGYGLDLTKCAVTNEKDNLVFVSPATGSAVTEIGAGQYKNKLLKLPKFLINEKFDHDTGRCHRRIKSG
jgi:DNA repair protein RecO (recombination protein O)